VGKLITALHRFLRDTDDCDIPEVARCLTPGQRNEVWLSCKDATTWLGELNAAVESAVDQ
jgi:hypothetical protein